MSVSDSTMGDDFDRPVFDLTMSVQDVAVSRGDIRIIRDISFTVAPGETIIVRGVNGAGKTTLLRAVSGLLRLDAGSITLRNAKGAAVEPDTNPTIYCGPSTGVKSALTVDENLQFWASLYGAATHRIDQARRFFGLDALANRRASTLSTGQARRLGLARLFLSQRPIWLIDEPTASLDKTSVAVFENLVSGHCARGGVAVIATHDAIAITDARSLLLAEGEPA